jgi:hypothetical protein
MSDQRDRIAQALLAARMVPSPWLIAPGQSVMMVPPNERDLIERAPVFEGQDLNAIQGQDVMDQYFFPAPIEEDI